MLTPNQDRMAYDALLNTLKASGVICKDAKPDWPMLIHVANEYVDHLNQVKDKPAVEPMDPQQIYHCIFDIRDQLVVLPDETNSEFTILGYEHKTQRIEKRASVVLIKEDARRLRNQLNQFLGG